MAFIVRLFFGLALSLGLSAQAFLPSGRFPTPDLDYNFTASSFYQPGTPACVSAATCLTTTRASVGYSDDTSGNWVSFANNIPRITNKGILVEEARTNSIRNNSMQGAGGSTQPTNWSRNGATSGLSFAYTTVTENGIDCVDIAVSGTPASTGNVNMIFEAAVTGAIGSWTNSAFLSLRTGSLPGTSGLAILETSVGTSGPPTTYTSTLTRSSVTRTTTTTNTLQPYVFFGVTSGVPVSFTMRIGWPQFELGSWATSPIRTTSATVTRAADVVTITTAPSFGSAYTLFASAKPNAPTAFTSNQVAFEVNDGTTIERSRIRRVLSTGVGQGVTTKSALDTVVAGATWTQAVSKKLAFAVAAADQALSQAGVLSTGSAPLPATPTGVGIGANQLGLSLFNGYIERATLWASTRLTNGQLQRITQ